MSIYLHVDQLHYDGKLLGNCNYVIMGQICIAKSQRKKGLFKQLYYRFKEQMQPHFDYIITEVIWRNQRSLQAHLAVGFENIHAYEMDGQQWVILLWKTTSVD